MKRIKKNNYVLMAFVIIVVITFSIFGYDLNIQIDENLALQEVIQTDSNNNVVNSDIEENSSNLKIHYIEKTTTNMIQKINPIFAVNPLISKEI